MLLGHQDKNLIASIHYYQKYKSQAGVIAKILLLIGKLRYTFWTVISGSDIHRDAKIAATVRFPHLCGVVVHRDVIIEDDCLIMQQVTLGQTATEGAPTVRRGAYIGAGAKVLGKINIGQMARIGANAVVLSDVPENATAVGVPAIVKNTTPKAKKV